MQNDINNEDLLAVGATLQLGKYRIDGYLSSGGFGNTYVVTNTQFEERYALKEFFMKGVSERDGDRATVSVSNKTNQQQFHSQREKFKKEARRLRKFHNPHIVRVYDLFEENGTAYYVMDFIDGESIAERIKRTKQAMTEAESLRILDHVLDALTEVHSNGIRHLDLKPANIMLDKSGNAVVIDFGASKQLDAQDGGGTSTSSMCYTAGYAPPEQMDQKMELIGAWTDLYALGGTLYYMLTQQRPPTVSEMAEKGAFQFPPTLSDKTRYLIRWMMRLNRTKRPQSVEEVRPFLEKPFQSEEYQEHEDASDVTSFVAKPSKQQPVEEEKKTEELKVEDDRKKVKTEEAEEKVETEEDVKVVEKDVEEVVEDDTPQPNTKKWLYAIPVAALLIAVIVFVALPSKKDHPSIPDKVLTSGAKQVTKSYFESALGVCSYTGPVDADGKPDGTGEASFTDKRLYRGPFVHGNFEGDNAFFRYENGDVFEGTFKNNQFAKGKYTLKADGSYFVGSFSNGQPAVGQWYDKNGNKI